MKDAKQRSPISIVVPCYNVESFVTKCINSIKEQTLKDYYVLMIDDGSTDYTAKIIKEHIADDPRFKYYHKPNGGPSSARNFGLKHVKTKYVCFIDSDDFVEPNYLELLYQSLKEEKSDISVCYMKAIYPTFENIVSFNPDFSGLSRTPSPCNKLFKTDLFSQYNINFLEGRVYEDVEITDEFLLLDVKFSLVPKPLYNYYQNEHSITHTFDETIYDVYNVVGSIEQFAEKNGLIQSKHSELEFINIFQRLVSTTTRVANRTDFSSHMLKDITSSIVKKYPHWYRNKYIATLPPFYRLYLYLLHTRFFTINYLILKIFIKNRYVVNKISKFRRK